MLRILSALTAAFPLWVLAAGVAALIRPGLFTWFSGSFITIGLGVIMLSMGMTLGFDDFRRVARERARVLPGVLLQYTVMPALGWGLGYVFALPTPFAIGLVLVSCCPGGTASNVIAFLARADVALSVTLTALSTMLAVVMTPILTEFLAGNRIDVPAGGLLLSTVQVVILPVSAGALLKWRFPRAIDTILPLAPLVATVAITMIVASVIGGGRDQIIESGPRLVLAVITLHTLGFLVGYAAGKVVLKREVAARTVSIEVGMQNTGLGVVLAQQNFANPLVAIPSAIASVFHSLVGSLVAAWWRRRPGPVTTTRP
ncbi:MAG: bile acid:sodium symporter family protein [Acidobacteriota bacterium]|nr:bile acid:sodium symporter family protein [Acidobacteriota bacterium]